MCGAISTPCKTKDCDGFARYDIYCYKCKEEED